MFSSIWLTILSLATGTISFISKMMDYIKTQQNIDIGKQIRDSEIKQQQAEIDKKQNDVLLKQETKDDTIGKLDNGKF